MPIWQHPPGWSLHPAVAQGPDQKDTLKEEGGATGGEGSPAGRGGIYPSGDWRNGCLWGEGLSRRWAGRITGWRDSPLGNLSLQRPKFLGVLSYKTEGEVQVLPNPNICLFCIKMSLLKRTQPSVKKPTLARLPAGGASFVETDAGDLVPFYPLLVQKGPGQ